VEVVEGRSRQVLHEAEAAVVKSGTSTLEASLVGCPQVIVYRVSWTTYQIMKRLLTGVKWIGLANIVPGKSVAKELIQYGLTPEAVADELAALLGDPARRAAMLADYAETRRLLGGEGATARAAALVAEMLPR
jgi:lipid-A-disaccharide synthase